MMMTCPLCRGLGEMKLTVGRTAAKAKSMSKMMVARELHESGHTYREIMEIVGYRSLASVNRAVRGKS